MRYEHDFSPAAPTRAGGLALLRAFSPAMGERYARRRNTDRGPGRHRDVSRLSPHIRRRLLTEAEVVGAAISTHGPEGAAKFIEEVVWRGYFKGWLERRPGVWRSYREGVAQDLAALEADRKLARRVAAAEQGTTGLACFDAWTEELLETGYLHNHARMWFASIWIFTLGLPWRLGADFFLRHLLDGDPASNTLGWRWVAGLHTRGKAYRAEAWNIARFTDGRFQPREADLARDILPLDHTEPDGLPDPIPLRSPRTPAPDVPSLLLITEEECCPESFAPGRLDIRGVVTLAASHLRSPLPVAEHVVQFEQGALADAAARVAPGLPEELRAGLPGDLARAAARSGAEQIVTGFVPTGPLRDWLDEAAPALAQAGIVLCEWQREWDRLVWPHATAGFFKVKAQIPAILHRAGLT